jgi:hypothetical protein
MRRGFGNAASRIFRARMFARPVRIAARGSCFGFAADRSRRFLKNIANQIRLMRRKSISSLKNKGFCNPVTFRCGTALLRFVPAAPLGLRVSDVASSGIAAAATVHFADRFEDHSAKRSLSPLDSVRVEAREWKTGGQGCPRNNLCAKWS